MSHKKRITLGIVLVTLALLAVATAQAGSLAQRPQAPDAPAVTHTVNSTGDGGDANPGDGACETGSGNGVCTLRAAIEETNALTGADTIDFDSSVTLIMPSSALPNVSDFGGGTTIRGNNTWIMGTFAGAAYGLVLDSDDNKLQGLLITDFAASGVLVNGSDNIVGTDGDGVDDAAEGNVLSNNDQYGIHIRANATGNWLAGNLIGLTFDGTGDAGNGLDGVMIDDTAHTNLIGTDGDGTSDALERNVISGNDEWGVSIDTGWNTIAGNYIGTNAAGDAAIPNSLGGVVIAGNYNLIGTDGNGLFDDMEGNVISGNGGEGVRLVECTSRDITIAGNYIGTNAAGDAALPNDRNGIDIRCSTNNLIGTDADGTSDTLERNVISGNKAQGVYIHVGGAENVVAGNYIGTNAAGNAALPNASGIRIKACANNRVGGTTAAERNVISGNDSYGVYFDEASANLAQGNYIGTDTSGTGNLGNGYDGVWIINAISNTISGNRIAFNGLDGIGVASTSYDNNLWSNVILSNGELGIDLYPDGVTANDAGDGDDGPNHLQNYPVLSSATNNAGQTVIQGTLNSSSTTTYDLDFYANGSCDPSGYGEGETYLGTRTVTTDGSGDASFTITLLGAVPAGYYVTATATDPDGNTSEFSQCRIVTDCIPVYDADFDWTPITPAIGEQVAFNGQASGSPSITFTWDFGDTTTGAGSTVTHTYGAVGTYAVAMTATNPCGADIISHTLSVVAEPVCTPVQIVTATVEISGYVASFAALLYGDAPFVYDWDFGDGATSSLETPDHEYAAAGTYTATLQVWNCASQGYDSHTFPVTVTGTSLQYKTLLPFVCKSY